MPETWDRQPNEPERAWQAFLTYRDLGPERSVPNAFRQHSGNKLAKQAGGQWNAWAKAHDWKSRALDYDRHTSAVATRAVDRVTEDTAAKWARRLDAQAEADFAFSQKYAGEMARRLNSPLLAEMPVKDIKDCVAVTVAASGLAWAAIAAALPDSYADLDPSTATTEQLTAAIERLEATLGAASAPPAPRIARTG